MQCGKHLKPVEVQVSLECYSADMPAMYMWQSLPPTRCVRTDFRARQPFDAAGQDACLEEGLCMNLASAADVGEHNQAQSLTT